MGQSLPNIKKVKYGKVERYSFAKINEPIEMPYLISIQKDAYKEFLEKGIGEILEEFSPITDYSGKAEIYFTNYTLDPTAKYTRDECKKGSFLSRSAYLPSRKAVLSPLDCLSAR